jgi:hypothetical protein
VSLEVDGFWKAGFWASTFWADGFWSEGAPVPTPVSTGGGGSGRRYPVGNLDLETWRKKGTRLKSRVEAVQKKIESRRKKLDSVVDLDRLTVLKKQIAALQADLMHLLAEMDMARKVYVAAEEDDAMMAYLAYRRMQ